MKKLIVLSMALLFAGSAFAQEVKKEEKKGPEFTYNVNAWAYGVSGTQKDYDFNYSHVRVRPKFTAGNENIKVVTQFEIDQDFGKETNTKKDSATPTANTVDMGKLGASGANSSTDNIIIEVKHAYIEGKDVIIPGLTLMGGLNGYKFPMVVDNDFAQFQAGYDFGMGKAILSYIKIDEYSYIEQTAATTSTTGTVTPSANTNQDFQAYALDLPIKIDNLTVRPGVIYLQGGKKSTSFNETALTNYALNVKGDMGMVAFTGTGAFLKGILSDTSAAKVKSSAYAADLGVDVKPADGIKIGAFFTYGSGTKIGSTKNKSYLSTMNTVFGTEKTSGIGGVSANGTTGAPDGRLFLLENATITSVGGVNDFDSMDNGLGYMAYGLSAEGKINKLTVFAQLGMASTAEKNAAGKTAIGTEIDVKASYEFAPKSSLFCEAAYLMAGDDMGLGAYTKAESAYQIAWGISTQI